MQQLNLKDKLDDPGIAWLAQSPADAGRRAKALSEAIYELEYLVGICRHAERRTRLEAAREELLGLRELLLASLDMRARKEGKSG